MRALADLIALEADDATDELFVRPRRLLRSLAGSSVATDAYRDHPKAQSLPPTNETQTFAEDANAMGSNSSFNRASSQYASAAAVEVLDTDTASDSDSRNSSSLDSAVLSDSST